jgi:hypothetical protein
MTRFLEAFVLVALLLPACGSEDATGVAPVLTNLTYSPTTVTAGAVATITGTVTFADADADVSQFAISARSPIGQTSTIGPRTAEGALGKTGGRLGFAVQLDPQIAGIYSLEIWMVDEAGNESNRLRGTVEAE